MSSIATMATVGLTAKLFWNSACTTTVRGVEEFRRILENSNRTRGIVTVANHISTLDDPLIWSALPTRYLLNPHHVRWTLGAKDICFTNPILSLFFSLGQVIPTIRGGGISQPAVDVAIEKLNQNGWIHIFPEGRVNQRTMGRVGELAQTKPGPHGTQILPDKLLRFKWGISRILMEAKALPHIVPLWLEGFQDVMPDDRTAPKWVPRIRKRIKLTFGNCTSLDEQIGPLVYKWKEHKELLRKNGRQDSVLEESTRVNIARLLREGVARTGELAKKESENENIMI